MKKADEHDRLVVKRAMDLVLKSPRTISEMEEEVRQFLRNAKQEPKSAPKRGEPL